MSEVNWCWSHDGEIFHEDFESVLCSRDDLKVGDVIFRGKSKIITADDIVDIDNILENMSERTYDMVGECADDYPSINHTAYHELKNLIIDWIGRRCPPSFFSVQNVEEYILTEEDMFYL